MANFKLDRFKKLLKQPATVWQGGVFKVPMAVRDDDGTPVQPQMAVWVDPGSGLVSNPQFVEDGLTPLQAALEALVEFGLDGVSPRHRPSAIEVQDAELATFLKGRLSGTGTHVECVESLPAIQIMLDELLKTVDHLQDVPGALSGKGVRIEHVRAFAEAAARFHAAQLWDELTAEDLIRVLGPRAPKGMEFFTVLGYDGQSFGLGFFESVRQAEMLMSGAAPEAVMGKKGLWSVNFSDNGELPVDDCDLWEAHDLPVAAADAFPSVFLFGPGTKMRRPSAKELGFVTGLLLAMADTDVDELDREEWTRKVTVGREDAVYRLALVEDAADEDETPLFSTAPPNVLRVMEKKKAAIHRLLAEQDFDTPEAANAFLNKHLDSLDSMAPPPETSMERAQEVVYEAWDATGRQQRTLARKALEICADCADAYVVLADGSASPETAVEFYRQGVEAGERALGPEIFERNAGDFWGILETRPYMRARFGLAQCLWALGRKAESVEHYEALLRLNPNDNQGVRHILAACLLELNDGSRLTRLFEQYEKEPSAEWQYVRALWAFRQEGDSADARQRAKEALKSNRHVPDFLSGQRRLPEVLPDRFQFGAEDEAVLCAAELGDKWSATPGAVEWLERLRGQGKRPTGRKSAPRRAKKK